MVEIEFSLSNCELVGEFIVELMFICIREHLIELESISCIDLNELIVIWCVYVCIDWLRKPSLGRR